MRETDVDVMEDARANRCGLMADRPKKGTCDVGVLPAALQLPLLWRTGRLEDGACGFGLGEVPFSRMVD